MASPTATPKTKAATTKSAPKTTRPSAGERRDPEPRVTTARKIRRMNFDLTEDQLSVRAAIEKPKKRPIGFVTDEA